MSGKQRADYIYKVILVGDVGVGKTTLIETATRRADQAQTTVKKQEEDKKCFPTGIDFCTAQKKVEGYVVDVQIYDTGDMQLKRDAEDITRDYYHGAHAALLLCDVTNSASFESLRVKWLQEVVEHCPKDCIKVIVANKVDCAVQSTHNEVEVKKWTDEKKLFYEKVSAISRDSVDPFLGDLVHLLWGRAVPTAVPSPQYPPPSGFSEWCCSC